MSDRRFIYAATDATFMEMEYPAGMETVPGAVMRYGKTFHLLTPEYWAWFYHKFLLMEKALVNGKISEATFEEILNRVSALYNHALALYGRETLKKAVRTTDLKTWEKTLQSNCGQPGFRPISMPVDNKARSEPPACNDAPAQTRLAL